MVGPPGTGKTSKFITQKYTELLLRFSHEKIIVLSHTKVAAEEIRDEILKLPEVTFKSGKQVTYNHDKVYSIMKDKLETMNCFIKYKSYTSSTSIPVILRDKEIV